MKWTDSRAIAHALASKHNGIDPRQVRFVQLREWVLALEDFNDLPEHCGDKILEAIQAKWINLASGIDDDEEED
jgi:FeS assembly protein IscX